MHDNPEKATQTFKLVEQATKQQNLQNEKGQAKGIRSSSGQKALNAVASDKVVDPCQAHDRMLDEVKALQPNHKSRLEAIERVEKACPRDLETCRDEGCKRELVDFVAEGKLKKSSGIEEVERIRLLHEKRARKEQNERKAERIRKKSEKMERQRQERIQEAAAAKAAAKENGVEEKAEEAALASTADDALATEGQEEAKEERAPLPEVANPS